MRTRVGTTLKCSHSFRDVTQFGNGQRSRLRALEGQKTAAGTTILETIVRETAAARKGDVIRYARFSTDDQNASNQKDLLMDVGAIRVFKDVNSGDRAKPAAPHQVYRSCATRQ